MEFQTVINKRKMVRTFSSKDVSTKILDSIIKNMSRGPSAGFSQGTQFMVINETRAREVFFQQWGPHDERANYREKWPNLENAPVIIMVLTEETAYRRRYDAPDKKPLSANVTPWWYIDAGMSVMVGLLSVVDQGLVATFTGIKDPKYLRVQFNIPDNIEIVGAILLGYQSGEYRPSSSLKRGRRSKKEIVHYNGW